MAHEPRTQRTDADDHTGKPCIHFGDQDGSALQFHLNPDAPGARVTAAMIMPFVGVVQVDVDLTHDQLHQLLSYFRENL